jgi:hypothetical protein
MLKQHPPLEEKKKPRSSQALKVDEVVPRAWLWLVATGAASLHWLLPPLHHLPLLLRTLLSSSRPLCSAVDATRRRVAARIKRFWIKPPFVACPLECTKIFFSELVCFEKKSYRGKNGIGWSHLCGAFALKNR